MGGIRRDYQIDGRLSGGLPAAFRPPVPQTEGRGAFAGRGGGAAGHWVLRADRFWRAHRTMDDRPVGSTAGRRDSNRGGPPLWRPALSGGVSSHRFRDGLSVLGGAEPCPPVSNWLARGFSRDIVVAGGGRARPRGDW